jgi:hypothetical protein
MAELVIAIMSRDASSAGEDVGNLIDLWVQDKKAQRQRGFDWWLEA